MKIGTLMRRDLARSKGRLAIVGAAVAAGVAVIVVLGALGLGLYRGVVEPLLPKLPLDLIKVEPRTVSLGLLAFDASALSGGLDARALDRLRGLDGVEGVYPIIGSAFPTRAEGGDAFFGHRMRTDLFATGLAPELVAGDVAKGYKFEDPGTGERKVPVLVARRLLDLYNSTLASAIEKPRLSPDAVIGFAFELTLGTSYARGTPDPSRVRTVTAEIVGFSDHANLVGVTVPEATLRRWNKEFERADPITGAYVKTRSARDVGPVSAEVARAGLAVDGTLEVVGAIIAIAALVLVFFVGTLLFLAAFAIAETFFLLIAERRTELAILRAMGAKRRDVRRLVLTEAAVVGAAAGVVGVVIGVVTALGIDAAVMALLPDMPFRPAHVVSIGPIVVIVPLVLGVVAAIAGAALPAIRASAASPASTLRT